MRLYSFFRPLSLMAVLGFLFVSCNNVPPHLQAVPAEAGMFYTINMSSLGIKGKLDDLQNFSLLGQLEQELGSENPELAAKLDELGKNPFAVGLDPLASLYAYVINRPNGQRFVGFTGKLADHKEFEEVVAQVMKLAGVNEAADDRGAFRFQKLNTDEMVFGWDRHKFILLMAGDVNSQANLEPFLEELFSNDGTPALVDDPDFREFINASKDISLWADLKMLEEDADLQNKVGALAEGLGGSRFITHLEFLNGEVVADGKWHFDAEAKKLLAGRKLLHPGGLSDGMMDNLRGEDVMAAGSVAFMPEELLALLKDKMRSTPQLDMLNNQMRMLMGLNLVDLVSAMGGQMAIVVDKKRSANDSIVVPGITVAMDMQDTAFYRQLTELIPPSMATRDSGQLQMEITRDLHLFSELSGDVWRISNWSNTAPKTEVEEMDSFLTPMQQHGLYFALNLEPPFAEDDMLVQLVSKNMRTTPGNVIGMLEVFKEFTVEGEDITALKATLKVHDASENSLFVILRELDTRAKQAI